MLQLDGKKLFLASKSPRRAQLLELMGFPFEVVASAVNEKEETYIIPEVQVLELAQKKAIHVGESCDEGIIIGADTIVVLDNEILGKPKDKTEAESMLADLSGTTHQVYSGFAILEKPSGKIDSGYEKTSVTFRKLEKDEIASYVSECNPVDKAGGYGIQERAAVFVTRIDGCFYNVMGFPVTRIYAMLGKFLGQK